MHQFPTTPPGPSCPVAGQYTVVAYGDSVTVGRYKGRGTITPYPVYLADDLLGGFCAQAAAYVAQNGTTAAQILALLQAQPHPIHSSRVVVVQAGENDLALCQPPPCVPAPQPTPLPQYQQSYRALVAAAVAENPGAHLLCTGIWWYNETTTNALTPPVSVGQYDAVSQTACQQAGGRYVPLWQLCADPANHNPPPTSDPYHPSVAGQQAIAAALAAALSG